jgi:predicted phage terminase large subunit-like protein
MDAVARKPVEHDARQDLIGLPFREFVEAFGYGHTYPRHFQRFIDRLVKADGGALRCAMSAPIQHGKSTLVKLLVVWLLVNNPKLRIAIFTYGQEFTEANYHDLREMVKVAGVKIADGADTKKEMRFETGGSLVFSSAGGRGTGLPIDVAIIDDPFKGPSDAYSKIERDKIYDWYRYVIHGRVPPNGSIICIASRWDSDDLNGRLINEQGYEELLLPAINADGEALCPWGPDPKNPRTLEWLKEQRDGKNGKGGLGHHAWMALFQGTPVPRDTAIFVGSAPLYRADAIPGVLRKAFGYDGGFTEQSDHSAAVLLGFDDAGGRYYVLGAWRWQRRFRVVGPALKALTDLHPGVEVFTYWSGAEIKAIQDLIDDYGIDIVAMPARYHKAFRAERCASRWSEGKISMPERAEWDSLWFSSEVRNFTGAEGDEDDGVDALVAAFDGLDDAGSGIEAGGAGAKRCM